MARTITAIPATLSKFTAAPINSAVKRKVAGYARVSTDHEEQITSYEAQVDYYTNYIKGRDDWEFVGIYSDEGISATNTKHRDGFNQMIEDALAGKIDLIITKSVSRFARNTVDSLTTVRKLKDAGIEVYFEKENIWTLDSKGELLITIMSSLAQEESRSISENTTWGQRKRFADGKVSVPYKSFLGYDKGDDGNLVINNEQAEIVRLIYKLYLDGLSFYSIANALQKRRIKSPMGKDRWFPTTIQSILTNEKYKGDALLQKCFTVDYLTKKMKKNEGEVPQYYVEDNHEAIISPQVFELVQTEMQRRSRNTTRYSGVGIFASKIKCGECGNFYGSKIWHSNDKYRRVIYRCNHKFKGEKKCRTPHVTEAEIKKAFVSAINKLPENRGELIENIEIMIKTLCDNTDLRSQQKAIGKELSIPADMTQSCTAKNARVALDQEQYNKDCNEIAKSYNSLKKRYDEVTAAIEKNSARKKFLSNFIISLKSQGSLITEFDERLWGSLVEYVTVYAKDNIVFTFKDGTEITA